MPRKYKKNFMRKKRRPTKKKVLMRKDVLVNRGPVFMPDTFYTTLTYCQTVDLGTGTAVSPICTRYTFSGNSIFDPNDEDIGQYPLGYNEMRSIYKEFYVSSSLMSMTLISLSDVDSINAARVVIWASNAQDPALSDINDVICNPNTSKVIVLGGNVGMNRAYLSHRASSRSQFGYKTQNERAYSGEMPTNGLNGDPPEQWFYHIFTENITSGATTPATINASIKIYYRVKLYNRRVQVRNTLQEFEIEQHDPATETPTIDIFPIDQFNENPEFPVDSPP